jgi:hypothetical protein
MEAFATPAQSTSGKARKFATYAVKKSLKFNVSGKAPEGKTSSR